MELFIPVTQNLRDCVRLHDLKSLNVVACAAAAMAAESGLVRLRCWLTVLQSLSAVALRNVRGPIVGSGSPVGSLSPSVLQSSLPLPPVGNISLRLDEIPAPSYEGTAALYGPREDVHPGDEEKTAAADEEKEEVDDRISLFHRASPGSYSASSTHSHTHTGQASLYIEAPKPAGAVGTVALVADSGTTVTLTSPVGSAVVNRQVSVPSLSRAAVAGQDESVPGGDSGGSHSGGGVGLPDDATLEVLHHRIR